MRQARVYQRIPVEGTGYLHNEEATLFVETVNLSKGGACLSVSLESWEVIENLSEVSGSISTDGEEFDFSGRIAWSSTEGDRVNFGVAFKTWDKEVVNAVIDRISLIDDTPPETTFNL